MTRWDQLSHQYENVLTRLPAMTWWVFCILVYLYFWLSLCMLEKALFYYQCFLRLQKSSLQPFSRLWDVTSESYWKTSDSPQESKTTFLNPGQECEWWWNFPKFSTGRIWIKWYLLLQERWRVLILLKDADKWTPQAPKMINPSPATCNQHVCFLAQIQKLKNYVICKSKIYKIIL